MNIYELTQRQQELIDTLYFLDETEDSEQIETIESELSQINKSAEQTLKYLSTILLQTRYDEQVANDEVSRIQTLLKAAQERSKRRSASKNRLINVMVRICNDFNIKSFKTQYADFRKTISPGSVVKTIGFDINKLPENFVRIIPESKEVDGKEVISLLRDKIKVNGKLDENVKFVTDDSLPGLTLVRTESIK